VAIRPDGHRREHCPSQHQRRGHDTTVEAVFDAGEARILDRQAPLEQNWRSGASVSTPEVQDWGLDLGAFLKYPPLADVKDLKRIT
jgi:hypothetical protein